MAQRKTLRIIVMLLLLVFVYLFGVYTSQFFKQQVASQESALLEPNMSEEALANWAANAAVAVLTVDYHNYERQLQHINEYFAPRGWDIYTKALQDSKRLNTIVSEKLISSAVPVGTPVIMEQGVHDGRYTWKVQLPVLMTYEGPSSSKQQNLLVTMIIQRTKKYIGKQGLGILSFVAVEKQAA